MALATDRQCVLWRAREMWKSGYRTFDTETTGLDFGNQIIQWAVADCEGNILGSGYVKPTVAITEGAFEVHGLTMDDLSDAPTFDQVWPTIRELLSDQTLAIYNADFDIRMIFSTLLAYDLERVPVWRLAHCAMTMFAELYGEVHEFYQTYTWKSLEVAAWYFDIKVEGQAHDARYDAAVTALVIKRMAELADKELTPDWHPPVDVPCAKCQRAKSEFWDANTIWYCQPCGLEAGVYHRCPGCPEVMETPATGIPADDLCEDCHKKLHREMMLLTGQWHWCSEHHQRFGHTLIVETSDQEELCVYCLKQIEWKRQAEETERLRLEKRERERKEYKRTYAREYRQRKKEEARINAERADQGLPPLEKPVKTDPDVPFEHHGHLFQRQRLEGGKSRVICDRCNGFWVSPPRTWCNKLPTYWVWSAIPEHLKTQTQLKKLHLKLAQEQKHEAYMETSYNRYSLYDQGKCIPTRSRAKTESTTT